MGKLILYILLSLNLSASSQIKFNGNFEQLDSAGNPMGWDLTFGHSNTYEIKLDSLIKKQGKYAISIASNEKKEGASAISFKIPKRFKGKTILLVGSIKTENVTNGFAGLWLRTEGINGKMLDFDNMESQQLNGTNDWKEYMVEIPYREESTIQLNVGALLVGKGKIWVDSLRLYVDRIPIEKAETKSLPDFAAPTDTAFLTSSEIDTVVFNKKNKNYLNLVGQLWGFLKYHHPTVAKGDLNWDAELFRILPSILKAQTNSQASNTMEKWVDKLGMPSLCSSCLIYPAARSIALEPEYGNLFDNPIFSKTLTDKLRYILANRNVGPNYYVAINTSYGDPGNPTFDNENPYTNMTYPDVGYRILALFRYWNIIQYFFPNRHLITEDWTSVLAKYIPDVILAKDKRAYTIVMLKLISNIHDSHANIHNSIVYEDFKGKYHLPLKAAFIKNKLVVTGYYSDTLHISEKFKIGDIITGINGITVKELVKRYLPITSASNYQTQLMRLPGLYLMRSNNPLFCLNTISGAQFKKINAMAVEETKINFYAIDMGLDPKKSEYDLLASGIAYIHAGRFKTDWKSIEYKLDKTKGIIIDMRTYPGSTKTFELINYIKSIPSAFVKYSSVKTNYPGSFLYSEPLINVGLHNNDQYKGNVVIIVNGLTISQAEFITMAFQSSKNVTVIGSMTAGADGSVSTISLPGGIETGISGVGIYYPDGVNTQRRGVRIDYIVNPTIEGIKMGKDELLEKAKQLINEYNRQKE